MKIKGRAKRTKLGSKSIKAQFGRPRKTGPQLTPGRPPTPTPGNLLWAMRRGEARREGKG